MEPSILLVDDDPDILAILEGNLTLDGYRVQTACTGKAALALFKGIAWDLIILDLYLPDMDGLQLCRSMRSQSNVPIIILTARDQVSDKVLGLETGADDYMVKPFDYLELAARIKVCLRRKFASLHNEEIVEIAGLRIDAGKNLVWKKGKKVILTRRENKLLLLLAGNSGKVMPRSTIRQLLWPQGELYSNSRAIDVHIQHLRSKLEDDPSEPKTIVTVPGMGYMFVVPGRMPETDKTAF